MEQIRVRLDFLWFLGLELNGEIPDHSVLSKARARWGEAVFEQLSLRIVQQCVQAGLVNGSLLHTDSTIVKAQASKDSVVVSGPELVRALRQAYQAQKDKLQVLPAEPQAGAAMVQAHPLAPEPTATSAPATPSGADPQAPAPIELPTTQPLENQPAQAAPSASAVPTPGLRVLPSVSMPTAQKPNSPAARYSRKRRQHVMEGSFADAFNNHGAKKARWRGLVRQKIQSWLIAAVQNLRVLLRNQVSGPVRAAAAARAEAAEPGRNSQGVGQIDSFEAFRGRLGSFWPSRTHERRFELY
jgi:IS5 family transposase